MLPQVRLPCDLHVSLAQSHSVFRKFDVLLSVVTGKIDNLSLINLLESVNLQQ